MSKIALGTVQFGINYGISSTNGKVKSKEVENILNYAYSKNIDLLDTAPAYGDSEKILGKATVQRFKIVTKTRCFDSLEIKNNDIKLLNSDFHHSLKYLKQDSEELQKKNEGLNDTIYSMHLGGHDSDKTYFDSDYFSNY